MNSLAVRIFRERSGDSQNSTLEFSAAAASSTIGSLGLLNLFARSYGDEYFGDDAYKNDFLPSATSIVCCGNPPHLVAAAIIVRTRIFAVATHPDTARFGYRSKNMLWLLNCCRGEVPAAWITIGAEFPRMIRVAENACMRRLEDCVNMQARIDLLGEFSIRSQTTMRRSPGGLIVSDLLYKSADYIQYAWGWPDPVNNK